MSPGRSSSAVARRNRSRSPAQSPPLSDLDLRILSLLSCHRVLPQTQLAAIIPTTPARTLRYRCARLHRHGLAGRTRPYRERGSAPNHLWPTRKGEAVVSGSPSPRGGERREPNPLFIAHAAGLSELYVALARTLPGDVRLTRFEREADARESFVTSVKRDNRAIAPDALIEITDVDGGSLLAFVELDMGTMSHRRLKTKAAGYAEYAKAEAWRERHRYCPALLFITTTEQRARSFLAAMRRELGRDALLLTCGCDLARRLHRCATDRWLLSDPADWQAVDLLAALREGRRPYDEELTRREAHRREEEAQRERLRSDPEALRSHLRSWRHRDWGIERLGGLGAAALRITLERDGALNQIEREALTALGAIFADPLRLQLSEGEPSGEGARALDALARHYGAEHLYQLEGLARRFGEGPALGQARRRLDAGELLSAREPSWLAEQAERDSKSRADQERLHAEYLTWREGEARRLAKDQGLAARLRNGPETFFDRIDRRALRLCRSCEEIAYPDAERAESYAKRHRACHCHYCGAGALAEIEPVAEDDDG